METWSSSVTTTFQVPNRSNSPILTHHRLKPTPLSHHHHHSAAAKTTATSSTYRPTSPKKDNFSPLYSSQPRKPSSAALPLLGPNFRAPHASVHRRAASGYAAALLDVAQSNGVVLEVGRDVRRLLRLLRNGQVKELLMDGFMEEREKGVVVVELVERGKFEGHLVGLVKLVIAKGKSVEIVKELLEEFERVFNHLAPVPVPVPVPVPALAT